MAIAGRSTWKSSCRIWSFNLLFFLHYVSAQYDITELSTDTRTRCYDDKRRPQRCIPEFVNAAFNVRVEASNTCGVTKPTEYCLQTGATSATKSCEICDNNTITAAHPAEYLTDFNNNDNQTWWQSETMLEGLQYPNRVNLTLNLGKSFDITYVRLKFYSSRPESFAIYKRTTESGEWIAYQYYSATCMSTYNIPDSSYVSKDNETRPLCTSEFSDISPLTGGNVAFSTLEGRPSAYNFENSPVLQNWVTATAIKITLDRMNTFGDEIFGDSKVLKSYYYGISDFAVGGRCKCNGHASECTGNFGKRLICNCEHNTAGVDCNECLPFYNDQPWGRASAADSHECKPCNCNGRSNKCFFDSNLWKITGHGGHCIECLDNTDGPNCERCKENYYEQQDGRCVPCNCHSVGSRNLQCNNQGQCLCKPGVEGKQCDRCAADFYDFTAQGCRPCGCNIAGSIGNMPSCDPVTGVCHCKENVEGQRCERCKLGFFDLQTVNEFGCLSCFCYGHSSECGTAPGYSSVHIESTFARDSERWHAVDYHRREVPISYNAIIQNIGVSAPGSDVVYFVAPARFLGDQRLSYNQFLSFVLRIGEEGPRATVEDIVLESRQLTISQPIFGQGNPMPTVHNQHYKFRLHENTAYGWNPRLNAQDFISLLSNLTNIKIKATYVPEGTGFIDDVRLETAQRSPIGQEVTWVEMCICPLGYLGQFCESCAPGYRRDPPDGRQFARCVPCNCNNHAEYCDPESGRCICQHNTAGDSCDRCAPGYYGNALQGTANDCQKCPCPDSGACVILPDDQVACLQCPQGYAGHTCQLCVDGYYGEPTIGHHCRKCECNGNIDTNAVGNCNTISGDCLKCIYNTAGRKCEKCLPGYYGNALLIPKGDCRACGCFPPGTVQQDIFSAILICNQENGQCPCKRHVDGLQCNKCEDGYWNISSNNGCETCDCNPIGSVNRTCDIYSGQCFCKEGVTGKKCNMCQDHHYGFSFDGCKFCQCDSVGSTSFQCEPSGQCICRPNVEGRRCDRCKENKYNKEAGCIDCPTCYNLVQDAVNEHREKMKKLSDLLDKIEKNPQVIDDENFLDKLEEVQQRVKDLLDDAIKSAGADGNLVGQLNDLRQQIEAIKKTSGRIAGKSNEIDMISDQGEHNITVAEEIIQRADEALNAARRLLDTDGALALDRAKERSEKFGQQSEKMAKIAREARRLADEHTKEAETVVKLADDAFNTSSVALLLAQTAIDSQEETKAEINDLEKQIERVADSLEDANKIGTEAFDEAKRAYDDILNVFTTIGKPPVPAINVQILKDNASDIIDEANQIQGKVDNIMDNYQEIFGELQKNVKEAEELLNMGEQQQQIVDELVADADAAKAKAEEAIEAGERTLKEAKETLKTLQDFDKSVQESKVKAETALEEIPEIQDLIYDAEKKTHEAEMALSGAIQDALDSKSTAEEAQKIAEEASVKADRVRDAADHTKDLAAKLKDQAEDIAERVAETADNVKSNEERAETDEDLTKEALEKANIAKNSAEDASRQVAEALQTVDGILNILDNLHDIDLSDLDELERKLDEAERKYVDANLDELVNELREERNIQSQWIKDYSEEVKQLKIDVSNIANIRNSLPEKCYRRVVLEP